MAMDVSTLAVKVVSDGIKDTSKDLNTLVDSSAKAEKSISNFSKTVEKVNNPLQATSAVIKDLTALLGGAFLLGSLQNATSEIIKMADGWALMQAKIQYSLGSLEKARKAQDELASTATQLRTPIEGVVQLYNRLVPAMQEYGFKSTDAMGVTKSMAAALKLFGATGAESSAVMLQFSQAMASGRLSGAEFNSVSENAPIILRALQKELGVTRAELKKMGADSKITTDILAGVMLKMGGEWADAAAKMPLTVDAAFTNLKTSFEKFIGTANETLGFTTALASVVESLGNNLETLAKIVGVTTATAFVYFTASALAPAAEALFVFVTTAGVGATASAALATSIELLSVAFGTLAKNPIVLALTLIAAGIGTVIALTDNSTSANVSLSNSIDDINKKYSDGAQRNKAYRDEMELTTSRISATESALKDLQAQLYKTGSSMQDNLEREKEVERLKALIKELKDHYKELEDQVISTGKHMSDANKKAIEKLDDELNIAKQQLNLGRKYTSEEKRAAEAILELKNATNDADRAAIMHRVGQLIELGQINQAINDREKAEKKATKETENSIKKYEQLFLTTSNGASDFIEKQKEQLSLGRKLTEGEKEAAKLDAFMAQNKGGKYINEIVYLRDIILANDALIKSTKELFEQRQKSEKQEEEAIARQRSFSLALVDANNQNAQAIESARLQSKGLEDVATSATMATLQVLEAKKALLDAQQVQDQASLAFAISDKASMSTTTPGYDQEQKALDDKIAKLKTITDERANELALLNNQGVAMKQVLAYQVELADKKFLEFGKSLGQTLTDAWDKGAQAIGKMITAYEEFDKNRTQLDSNYSKTLEAINADSTKSEEQKNIERLKLDDAYNTARLKNEASTTASLLGFAKGLFNERSKGYKALETAEKTFRVLEMLLAAKSFAQKIGLITAETLANKDKTVQAVAGAATESAAAQAAGQVKAVAGVANQATGDPYSAFARMAAMAAIMAALGYAVSGAGGSGVDIAKQRQESAGTGSVLGDATKKSESISKAMSILAENSKISLRYNAGMLDALRNIEAAMTGLAKNIIKSSLGKSLTSSVNTDFQQSTIGSFAERAANDAKKIPFVAVLDKVTGGIVNGLISKIASGIGKLFGSKTSVTDYGIFGNPQKLIDALSGGLELQGYTQTQTKKKAFGITYSQSNNESFQSLDKEVTDQLNKVIVGLADSVKEAGKALGMDSNSFVDALNGFVVDIGHISLKDLTGEQIQEQLSNIFSKIGDDMAKKALPALEKYQKVGEGYFETLVRVASSVATLDGILSAIGLPNAFKLTGMAAIEAKMQFIDLAGGLDSLQTKLGDYYDNFYSDSEKSAIATKALQEQFAALGMTMPKTREEFRSVVDNLVNSTGLATEADRKLYAELLGLAKSFADLVPVTEGVVKTIDDLIKSLSDLANSALSALEKSINAEKSNLKSQLDSKVAALNAQKQAENDSYNAQKEAISNSAKAQNAFYSSQIDAQNAQLDVVKNTQTNLKSLFDSIKGAIDGLVGMQSNLEDQTYKLAKAQLYSTLASAKAGGALPTAEAFSSTLSGLKLDSSNFTSSFEFNRERLSVAGALTDLNSVVGNQLTKTDDTIAAIGAVTQSIQYMQKAADDSANKALADLDAQHKENLDKIDQQIKEAQDQYNSQVAYLDGLLSNAKDQLAIANGTYEAVLSVHDALTNFNSALQLLIEANAKRDAEKSAQIDSMVQTAQTMEESNVKKDEAIFEMTAQVQSLRDEMAAQNRAIALNTAKTAKILGQWDGDGQPEVRAVA